MYDNDNGTIPTVVREVHHKDYTQGDSRYKTKTGKGMTRRVPDAEQHEYGDDQATKRYN